MHDSVYYSRLEQGARYLAARATTPAERDEHLGWANRYYRLSLHTDKTSAIRSLEAAA